jgi:hypothetical protein
MRPDIGLVLRDAACAAAQAEGIEPLVTHAAFGCLASPASHIRAQQLRQNNPTGRIPLNPSGKSGIPVRPVSPDKRGVAQRHETRGLDAVDAGDGGDDRLKRADGEVVWAWRPDAGVKFRG